MHSMRLVRALLVIGGLAMFGGCGGGETEDSAPAKQLAPAVDADFVSNARAASNALRVALKSELVAAMEAGGPAAAVEVCRTRAEAIAAEVSASKGVEVGRVSTRQRNPGNAADPIQAAILDRFQAREDFADTSFVADGRATYMRAIRIGSPACLKCHGDESSIDGGLLATLREHYPDDRATGFSMGDLRGAFVVRAAETAD